MHVVHGFTGYGCQVYSSATVLCSVVVENDLAAKKG